MSRCEWQHDAPKIIREHLWCKAEIVYGQHCEEHLSYSERNLRDYEATPREVRQQYLDELNSGKTIGQSKDIAGISLGVACEITNRAIGTRHFLKREAE